MTVVSEGLKDLGIELTPNLQGRWKKKTTFKPIVIFRNTFFYLIGIFGEKKSLFRTV